MAIVIPAIRGKLGNAEYFETTMKVRDLVHAVRPQREMDGWANFSIEERMQREPDVKRIQSKLAPYIAKNQGRFFGSPAADHKFSGDPRQMQARRSHGFT